MEAIKKAKADGRWENAYDSPSNMTVPEDFLKALSKNKKAEANFRKLNKTNRFAIGFRLQTAKKQETREKRTKEIIDMLAKGDKFHLSPPACSIFFGITAKQYPRGVVVCA